METKGFYIRIDRDPSTYEFYVAERSRGSAVYFLVLKLQDTIGPFTFRNISCANRVPSLDGYPIGIHERPMPGIRKGRRP